MANDPKTVAQTAVQQNAAAIADALKRVTVSASTLKKISTDNAGDPGIEASAKISKAHGALVLDTMKLLSTIRGPLDSVWGHFENAAHTGALRALLEMGVFDALPANCTSMSAHDMAEKLKVDEVLLVRLMRCATLNGPFVETSPQTYAHTPYSLVYQVPVISGLTKLMVDEYGPAKFLMGRFFKENGFSNPTSQTNNPYTFAHQTKGETMWEFMGHFPDRADAFNYAMQAQTQAMASTIGIFPFAQELKKAETDTETVLAVDIGGGKGHATEQIRTLAKEIPGKVVLQDLPSVIDDITEPLPGVERMKYDFYTPQPIKGAQIYYIRRVLHDWSDEECVKILRNIADAMVPGQSRLLISEIIIPDEGADLEAGWMDLTMMTLTGCERTLKQWKYLLDQVGLKFRKTWTVAGTNHGVVEACLDL